MLIEIERRPLLLLLLLLLPLPSSAEGRFPLPFTALYQVTAAGLNIGEMQRRLWREGDTSHFETEIYTTGLAQLLRPYRYIERSRWQGEGDALRADYYEVEHQGKGIRERERFEWDQQQLYSERRGVAKQQPLPAGVVDKQLYQLLLRRDLAAGLRQMRYQVADRGSIKTYAFEVLGEERVQTPFGELQALRIERGETRFWCAPSLDYLVVRLTKEEDGKLIEARLQQWQPQP